jgi:hypothetical protein
MADEFLIQCAKEFTQDDLPNDGMRWLADEIGMEAAVRVIVNLAGTALYAPVTAKTALKRKYAQKHYDGHNSRRLALQLDVAERTIFKWIGESEDSFKKIAEQTSLF